MASQRVDLGGGVTISYDFRGKVSEDHQGAKTRYGLVMLHGYGGSSAVWRNQLEFFSPSYDVLAPDLRGWGHSSNPGSGKYELSDFINDIDTLTQRLWLTEHLVLMGSSMGGLLAQAYTLRNRDKVGALVLVGTRAKARGDLASLVSRVKTEGPEQIVRETITKCFTGEEGDPQQMKKRREELKNYLLEHVGYVSKDTALGSLTAFRDFDLRETLKALDIPTLIVFGERDRITTRDEAELLHSQIAGSELKIIPKVGHLPMLEAPELFNSILANFLSKLP